MSGQEIALISTSCTVSSALCMLIGWIMIRQKRVLAHRNLMILSAILAAAFFTLYMYRTICIGNTDFGGPDNLKAYYYIFLLIHVTLAIISPILAIITFKYAAQKRFKKHKKIARWTASIWFVTAFTAVLVYLLLFVIFEPGITTNHWLKYFG